MGKVVKIKFFYLFLLLFLLDNNNLYAEYLEKQEVSKLDNYFNEECINKFNVNNENYSELYWKCKIDLLNNYITDTKKNKDYDSNYVSELNKIKQVFQFRLEESIDLVYQKLYKKRFPQKTFLNEKYAYYYDLIKQNLNYELILLNLSKKKALMNKESKLKEELHQIQIKNKCSGLKNGSKEHDLCIIKYNNVFLCYSTLDNTLEDKIMENKFKCKTESIKEFPDNMVLYNERYEMLINKKQDEFIINRAETAKLEKTKREFSKQVSGPKISKEQLIVFRNEVEKNCIFEKEKEIEFMKQIITKECEAL